MVTEHIYIFHGNLGKCKIVREALMVVLQHKTSVSY